MMKNKYVAEGFFEDAGRLLSEFREANSVDFPVFASLWQKHNFSLVFVGRPDKVELSEFINETYRITTQFLSTNSFLQRVGAIFLLYGLFRNQISNPPIRIRLELTQWKLIERVWREAAEKDFRTLNYVIDYLINNAFVYVANQTLKGPMMGTVEKLTKNAKVLSNLRAAYKDDLTDYKEVNSLTNIHELHCQYAELKKGLEGHVKCDLNVDTEIYKKYSQNIDNLLHLGSRNEEVEENIGTRRAKIKAAAFSNKSSDFLGRKADSDESIVENTGKEPVKRRSQRTKRVPKHLRKVGRPSLYPKIEEPESEDSDNDISNLLTQQKDFYLPPEETSGARRCRRTRAVRTFYYKASPKREDSD